MKGIDLSSQFCSPEANDPASPKLPEDHIEVVNIDIEWETTLKKLGVFTPASLTRAKEKQARQVIAAYASRDRCGRGIPKLRKVDKQYAT